MHLESLSISRAHKWDNSVMPLKGEAEFISPKGAVKLVLNEETARKILAVVAQQLVETSKELAEGLTVDIIQSMPALENHAG